MREPLIHEEESDEVMSPRIRKQFTFEDRTELEVEVPAVNAVVARQRARVFARRHFPTARNIFHPEVSDSVPRQTTFSDLFPESISREDYRVKIVIEE